MFRFLQKAWEKKTEIDFNTPDAVVTVTNTHCSKNPLDNNYCGFCALQENRLAKVFFQTIDGNNMLYQKQHCCLVKFRYPDKLLHTLWIGREVEIYEGKYLVGIMTIEEIKNPILDRTSKYETQNDILENSKILNIALKLSLEWGKKYNIPLDSKLMKSVPTLSGKDIDIVSKYVVEVREDVFWKIYYPNWDIKKQNIKIDAKKVTSEKYPWIDNHNLTSLHSQGMYYAWHG